MRAAARILDRAGAHPRRRVTYKLGAPGRHLIQNSLAVLAAVKLAGADLALAALALAELAPPTGRGARMTLDLPGGRAPDRRELQRQSGFDARRAGAARPGRRSARAAGASRCSATCWNSGRRAPQLHRGLADAVIANAVDLVFCSGPLMRSLWEALPSERRGGYAEASAALEAEVLGAVRAGDAVMVKGSLGSQDGPDRQGADARNTPVTTPPRRRHKADPMLYWLADLSGTLSFFNVFRYLTVRTGGAMMTALVFVFLFGPWIIDKLRVMQGKGQPIRADGPKSHFVKAGTPTMGGLMILIGDRGLDRAVGQSAQPLRLGRARGHARLRLGRLLRRSISRSRSRPPRASAARCGCRSKR